MKTSLVFIFLFFPSVLFAQANKYTPSKDYVFLDSVNYEMGKGAAYLDKTKLTLKDSILQFVIRRTFEQEEGSHKIQGAINLLTKETWNDDAMGSPVYTDKIIAIYQSTLKKKKK